MLSLKKPAVAAAIFLFSIAAFAQWSQPADDVPAYHATPAPSASAMPVILSGQQLTGDNFRYPWQAIAYRDAAKIQKVIYQLPCYCRCDRAMGHQSLHSCFEGLHGAECSTCAKELFYAYQQTMKGRQVKEIRDGIMRKEYLTIDLDSIKA